MLSRRLITAALLAFVVACGPKGGTKPTTTAPPDDVTAGPGPSVDSTPAQGTDEVLPLWSAVKKGKLANGLTYYIMPHKKPEQRALLWLAVNAAAVQEDDDQRGLAHLIEHMAFNGTKRFPKAAIVNYLETIGMDFGADLNASTGFDETVYKITVPTDKPEYVTKGLEILRDWAGDITFDPAEVDKERPVVLEEWRLGRGAGERIFDKQFPVLFKGSRYASRLPIGLPDTLKTAPRDTLVRYYKDWYRPDLMAVIAVGDFADVPAIEKQIQQEFGSLVNPAKERQRPPAGVPVADGTRVTIVTDREMPVTVVQVYNMLAHRSEATVKDFRRIMLEGVYDTIINERLGSLGRKADAPFVGAGVGVQDFTREVDVFGRSAVVKGTKVEETLRALFAEVLRVEKHGFTQAELDRARTNILRNYEQGEVTAESRESQSIVEEIERNFFESEFMIGPVAERSWAMKFLPTITLADLNGLTKAYGGAENRAIAIAGPDGSPLPTQERVLAIIKEVEASSIEPWQEKAAVTTLMAQKPAPGKITAEKMNDKLGTIEWTLSNGSKVIVLKTDYEKDSVNIAAVSPGGLVLATPKQFPDARFADDAASLGGAGELDDETLEKALTGKQVSVSTSISETTESVAAAGSARDIETMLQLIYLKITAPRKDAEQFAVWQANYAEQLDNQLRDPETQFSLKSQDVLFKNNVRRKYPTAADVKKVNLDNALAFYKDRFGDVTDFTWVIVGSIDPAALKPLVETYLASLPAKGRVEKEKDPKIGRIGGVVKKTWNLGQEPKASVELMFHGPEKWTRDSERDIQILAGVLSIRLREVLREDMGGVYGVNTYGYLTRLGKGERTFGISFGCDPSRVDELVKAVQTTVADVAKNGVSPETIEKVKQTYLREREKSMKTNDFWIGWLSDSYRWGDDPNIILDTAPRLARMTNDNVKASAKRYISTKQYYQAVLLPSPAVKPAAPAPAPK